MTDRDGRYIEVAPASGRRLAAAIKKQMDREAGFTQAELVRRSDVSHPTVRSLMRGEPGRRARTEVRKVSAALGWTPDSIEHVLTGGEPDEAPTEEDAGRIAQIEQRVDVMERRLTEIGGQLTEIQGQVELLLRSTASGVVRGSR